MRYIMMLQQWKRWLLLVGLASSMVRSEDSSASSGNDNRGNYYTQFSVCDGSVVMVQELQIVCDSPGAYYYGSNKYRNSASCHAGDKGKLEVLLEITENYNSNYESYLTLSVNGYGSISDKSLFSSAPLCDTVRSVYGTTCPEPGYYRIKQNFYWGQKSDNYEYSFKPKIVVGIASTANSNRYDVGGANTQKCNGGTFINWSTGIRKSAANTVRTFFLTFGILLGSMMAIFAIGYYIMSKASNQSTETAQNALDIDAAEAADNEMDKENEYQKMAMVGSNRNLVDF